MTKPFSLFFDKDSQLWKAQVYDRITKYINISLLLLPFILGEQFGRPICKLASLIQLLIYRPIKSYSHLKTQQFEM